MSELNDDPAVTAQRLGLDMVLPKPTELFVDLDSKDDEAHYAEMMGLLMELSDHTAEMRLTESAGGNRHAYLVSKFLSDYDAGTREQDILRIALQACLGSDRKRELLSLLRILLRLDRPPTVFFERPGVVPTAPDAAPISEDLPF